MYRMTLDTDLYIEIRGLISRLLRSNPIGINEMESTPSELHKSEN